MKRLLYILLLLPLFADAQVTLLRQSQIRELADTFNQRIKYADTFDRRITTRKYVDSLFGTAAGGVPTSRTISTTAPLSGGGDLSANRTLSIADAAADGTTKGAATFTAADFNTSSGVVSIDYPNAQQASGSVNGFLSSANYTNFLAGYNDKINSAAFSAGQLTLTQQDAGTVIATINDATTSVKGIASFATANFAVTSGAVTVKTDGIGATELAPTAVSAGSCTNCNLTIDADGRVTAQSNGSGGSGTSPVLYVSTTDAAVSNTATETTIIGAGTGSLALGIGTITQYAEYVVEMSGVVSTTASADALALRFKFGSTTLATCDLSSTNALNTSITNGRWSAKLIIVCRTTGGTGTIQISGDGFFPVDAGTFGGPLTYKVPFDAISPVTISTLVSNTINVTADWNAAAVGRAITCKNFTIKKFTP